MEGEERGGKLDIVNWRSVTRP
jgi:hypothetical protein